MREMLGILGLALGAISVPAAAAPEAVFDQISYKAIDVPEAASGNFRNPVLPGFHPDPSIVRVGDDYYMVTSTFSWFPGIPVFHSKDLVNWELISHGIERGGQLDFTGMRMVTDAVYAPAITWHEGTFYIFNTCVRCGGNFFVTATDPAGPWSDPVWTDFEGIDPSLYFDDDGSAWVINNDAPQGGSKYEGHRALWIQQIDIATGKMFGPRTQVVDGGVDLSTKPIWAEGPHIIKRDGWYYINAAEGGTAQDHSQTIYRSRSLTGPYVPGPTNPTLTQRDMPRPRPNPVEATGHADFVELPDGSWWAIFLATRPFEDQLTLLGRETWLLPVEWRDGWPIILDQGKPVPFELKKPNLPEGKKVDWSTWTDDFSDSLSGEWLQMRNPSDVQWYAIDRDNDVLRVVAGDDAASSDGKPHFLGRRMRHPKAEWTTSVSFAPETEGDLAGLMAFGSEDSFLVSGIEKGPQGNRLVVRQRKSANDPANGAILAETPLANGTGPVALKMTIENGTAKVDYRPKGRSGFTSLLSGIDVTPMASVRTGLFTGVVVGPYAVEGGAGR